MIEIPDDRGNVGYIVRTENHDFPWNARPSWLTGEMVGYSTRSLGRWAKADQIYAADSWEMAYDEYGYPEDDLRDDQKDLRNCYLMARWWRDAYLEALKHDRERGN